MQEVCNICHQSVIWERVKYALHIRHFIFPLFRHFNSLWCHYEKNRKRNNWLLKKIIFSLLHLKLVPLIIRYSLQTMDNGLKGPLMYSTNKTSRAQEIIHNVEHKESSRSYTTCSSFASIWLNYLCKEVS